MYALTGASGHLGRLVIQNLLEKVPANTILATTRSPEKLADLAEKGVVVRHADLNDPASLPAAFEGATRLLIISTDSFDNRADQHRAAVAGAVQAGVKHLVYTSAPAADANSFNILLRTHGETEEALKASGIPFTALRNNIYNNELAGTLGLLSGEGKIYTLEGDGKPIWLSREDCARIATAALLDENIVTGIVDVTGPEPLGIPELAARLSQIQGKEIPVQVLTDEEMIAHLGTKGFTPEAAGGFLGILKWFARGDFSQVSDVVEKYTGVKPGPVDPVLAAIPVA
ncbi:MAG: NmrA family NAD(P)-binding protein [Chloroflexi bacterium]|nr:NmrA family NAD(P)-binding protein [Chloroflexota bacterium]OJV92485.1 MAG: hypothetical protein BGO39_31700 [Chloroflexi bacterium 54-19]